jgi:type I restriction-modification system DNA methylase subunit
MSEELIQRNLYKAPERMGPWSYYNIGATSLKELKSANIIPDYDYAEFEGKKPDALVIKKPQVIAAIEYKKPSQLKTEKQISAAISQEIGTAAALGAKIYIVTDGQRTFWINPLSGNEIKSNSGESISLNFNKDDMGCIRLIAKAIASLSATNDILHSADIVDPLPLAQKVWQDLWAVSGATPENCLYTFVEIFMFKYLSDLGVLTGLYSFTHLIAQYSVNTDKEVLECYVSTVRIKIKELFPGNPKDKTTIINGTIFVSKDDKAMSGYAAVFRKIIERFQEFGTLENIDYDFKSKLFETFLKESISKKNWGQFFTPLKVVRAIVSMTDISVGMKICDPACGVGKFLLEPILHDIHRYFKVENEKLIPQITLAGFDKGFDRDEQKTIILAKANMLIYLSEMIREHSNITAQFAELFNKTFLLQTNSILGTLAMPMVDEYDLILTNPPYVMSGSSNLKDEISKRMPDEVVGKQKSVLEQHYAISAMGVEGLFMEWIIRALKPSGKAFVVVPDGMMNRSNDKRLRDFVLAECEIDAIISLPLNTFFTTNKKTYILALTKKEVASVDGVPAKARQKTPVFTYLCSEIGESRDVYRFDLEQNDLESAAQMFNMFKGVKNNLAATQKLGDADKRCKIVDIEKFYTDSNWSIERWWTSEERIELGIEDETERATSEELGAMFGDLANTFLEYKDIFTADSQKKKESLKYKTIKLTNNEYFSLISGGVGKNKTQLQAIDTQNQQDIPVYTAAKAPVAYIKPIDGREPVFASAEQPMISFATNGDGSAGRNFVVHTAPFYLNVDRIAVASKNPQIVLMYVCAQISDMKEKYGFNHSYKANRHNLKNVTLPIPVSESGDFDVAAQNIVAAQFELISQIKDEMRGTREKLKKLIVDVDLSGYAMVYKPITELFAIERGKGKYTKAYTRSHKGEYPLFSGNTFCEFAFIDTYDYCTPCLTWAIDGLAGYMMVHKAPFSATNHRGILVPKIADIDIDYIKYVIEPTFRQMKKGRIGDGGENEYTSLPPFMLNEIEICLPVDNKGKVSLPLQQEIAEMYANIEYCRSGALSMLDSLIAQRILY